MNVIQLVCLIVVMALYVLADGFALGIGLLLLLGPRQQDRDAMVKSFVSIWSSNDKWLGVAALALALSFPFVVAVLPKSFLVPLGIMAFALMVRGRGVPLPSAIGPIAARMGMGARGSVGASHFVSGLRSGEACSRAETDRGLDSIFVLLCAAILLGGYVLLGAGWLIWRASAPMRTFGREVSPAALILVAGGTVIAFASTLLITLDAFALPDTFTPLLLLLGAAVCVLIWRNLWSRRTYLVFLPGLALFAIGLAGLADMLWLSVDGVGAVPAAGVAELGVAFCVGAVLVITFPITISQIFRGELAQIDASQVSHLVPCAGCRRSRSLPAELHFS